MGRFSPDGRYIAYVSGEPGREEVYVQPVPPATGGRVQVSANGGAAPRWSGTNRELFFVAARRGTASAALMAVDMQPGDAGRPAPGPPRKLFDVDSSFGNLRFDVHADGQRFLVTRPLQSDVPNTPIKVWLNWWVELAKSKP
jgi:dipeptidyl aminopeptidase/acylaminoacyl peptidase